ncbi:DUF1573 domain-containing protein [Rosettibacter firmus]|uniref:DUF1573 domain-containing protein n=1 Tax=Rosettibacter firmus TaxID=3111522 RepID=UPI00336BCF38
MNNRYLFLIFLCTIFITSLSAQKKSPKIYSPEPSYSFGEIIEGQIVEHEFEIINNGDDDLIIKDVRASCGCTAVQPSKRVLKPKEKTKIKVEFDSRGRIGPQKKYVYVLTNDLENPRYQLSFDANVVEKISSAFPNKKPKLVLSKNEYNFGEVEEGKVVQALIDIKNEGNDILEIKEVKTTCGCTAVLLSNKKLHPKESGTLKISLDTSNREGQLVRTVSIFSNDPEESVKVITLSANIKKRK